MARSRSKPEAARAPSRGILAYGPWIVAAVTILVFLPALGGEFLNWDDDQNFLNNPSYRGLGPANVAWAFETFLMGHYHPLTWLTLELDYVIWGMNPTGYRLTNVLLHGATAAVVYLLFLELLRLARREETASRSTMYGALFGALFFAVHPLRVESVAWASERRDVLCGLFYALTLRLYLRGKRVASLATLAAALLSKVLAATLPAVIVILDLYPLRRRITPRLVLEKIPYFALAVAVGLFGIGRYDGSVVPGAAGHDEFMLGLRLAMSVFGVAFYLWKTVWPFGLYAQYVYNPDPQPFDTPFVVAGVAVLVITIAVLAMWRTRPYLIAVWAAFAATLLPVLSFLRFDRQNFVADHHSYLATLGFAALAGGLLAHFAADKRALRVAAVVTLGLIALTVAQIPVWKDSKTLWAYTVENVPAAIVANNNLGRAYAAEGDLEKAREQFERAVAVRPDYAHGNYNLAVLLMRQGELAEAEKHFETAAAGLPAAQTFSDWGNCLLRQRRPEDAITKYERAIEVRPDFADAHFNLGLALEAVGRSDEARRSYAEAARLDPQNDEARRRMNAP